MRAFSLPLNVSFEVQALAQQLAQQMLVNLYQGLATGNGTSLTPVAAGLQNLEEGIPLWVANLKAKRQADN
jgi:hypothetical protein